MTAEDVKSAILRRQREATGKERWDDADTAKLDWYLPKVVATTKDVRKFFTQALDNRFRSSGVDPLAPPADWLGGLGKYSAGPLNAN